MNSDAPKVQPTEPKPSVRASLPARLKNRWVQLPREQKVRLGGFMAYAVLLMTGFAGILVSLITYTMDTELHSHVVLVPFVSIWLLQMEAERLPSEYRTSAVWGTVFVLAGAGALLLPSLLAGGGEWSLNDRLGAATLAFLCLLVAGMFFFLGRRWVAAAVFPVCFLIFMIPLPDGAVTALEDGSLAGTAEVTNALFILTGTPIFREGYTFSFPGIGAIEIARECSGIRSSWVLFITCLIASRMFLKSPWKRFILAASVIPLGLMRNGLRVATISWLCLHVDESMIDSWIHHRGGPFFFALSLVPLGLLVLLLRRSENSREPEKSPSDHGMPQAEGIGQTPDTPPG